MSASLDFADNRLSSLKNIPKFAMMDPDRLIHLSDILSEQQNITIDSFFIVLIFNSFHL